MVFTPFLWTLMFSYLKFQFKIQLFSVSLTLKLSFKNYHPLNLVMLLIWPNIYPWVVEFQFHFSFSFRKVSHRFQFVFQFQFAEVSSCVIFIVRLVPGRGKYATRTLIYSPSNIIWADLISLFVFLDIFMAFL